MRSSLFVLALAASAAACTGDDACPPSTPTDAGHDARTLAPARDAEPDDGALPPPPPDGRPTVYYVIRHAERDPGLDPPLDAEGQARAARLASLLGATGFDEVVVTSFVRNQQTAEPIAAATGVPVTVAPITMVSWPAFGTEVGQWQRAREVPGSTVLMIGHSGGYNTALLAALGANVSTRERYQDLVILVRDPDGRVRTSTLEYGGPSSLD